VTVTHAPDPELAEQLLATMVKARWFAGKGRRAELTGLTRLAWLGAPGDGGSWPAVRFEVAEVRYPDFGASADEAPHELYQLALSYYPVPQPGLHHAEVARFTDPDLGPCVTYDAAQDPRAGRLVLGRLLGHRRPDTPTTSDAQQASEGEVIFHLVPGAPLSLDLEPLMFTGQQSNTSIMYGDVAMLKLFRRLEIGHNLDIEVHEALARAGVADVAALYGWIEARWPYRGAHVHADLAMVVEKLRDAEDGWGLALDSLRAGGSFAEHAARLGAALADIHQGLRDAFGVDRHSGASTAALMKERLAAATAVAPALLSHVDALNACFTELAETEFDTQRVHGDFHLGQTLHVPGGWKIIDFEGEPAKTLAERAALDSVWRDIAGMLRSFDYAGASVSSPDSRRWVAECREAFLTAYAGGELGEQDSKTLRAYEADKAVYEVVYEVRNRPDWVSIPLGALAELTSTAPTTGAPHPSADDAAVKE
jgi:maltokinase